MYGVVVTEIELDTMCRTITREDILSVYTGDALTAEEEEEILKQADHALKVVPQYTKEDIHRIVHSLPVDNQGYYSFHGLQKLILQARAERVHKMKDNIIIEARDELKEKLLAHRTKRTDGHYAVAPASMFIKDDGLNGSQNAVLISKMLNRGAFQISTAENCNSPELTQNVRFIRGDYDDPRERKMKPWCKTTKL